MVDIILGLQWGDEGKGKIADFLTPRYDIVARFQGGPNAGHSLEFEGKKFVLNTIPSGIFRKGTQNLIGNGVVVDPIRLLAEIDRIKNEVPDYSERLLISKKAHLILPTHRILDAAGEKAKGENKIGSTLRGIGPAYRDKTGRAGLRIGDIMDPNFDKIYRQAMEAHLWQIQNYAYTDFDLQAEEKEFLESVEVLRKMQLINSEYWINEQIASGKKVLAEGAQGSMLDVEFGTYPFVTSSNTMAGGACTGLGVAPNKIGKVYGIFKAYCTRVGGGPFPTELEDETGEWLRQKGHEFGATTGRPRRTGWLDLVALNYACMINGVDSLIMMKSDILDEIEEVKVATEYIVNGETVNQIPANLCTTRTEPIYKTFEGWKTTLDSTKKLGELPVQFQNYIEFIENYISKEIDIISLGPERDKTIVKGTL